MVIEHRKEKRVELMSRLSVTGQRAKVVAERRTDWRAVSRIATRGSSKGSSASLVVVPLFMLPL